MAESKESTIAIVKNVVRGASLRDELVDFFCNCGNIAGLTIVLDQTDPNLSIAIITFTHPQAVKIAVQLDGSLLNDRPMSIRAAPPTFLSPPTSPNDPPLPSVEGGDQLKASSVFTVLIQKDYQLPENIMIQYKPKTVSLTNDTESKRDPGEDGDDGDRAGDGNDNPLMTNNLKAIIESFSIRSVHGTSLRAPPTVGARVDLQVTAGSWETFDLVPLGTNRVAIKTIHGTYLRSHAGRDAKVDTTTNVGSTEEWLLTKSSSVDSPTSPSFYCFQSVHGSFLKACPGGEGAVVELSPECGKWESWQLQGRSKPKSLKSVHGTYLRCHPGSDGSPVDLQSGVGPWESLVIEKESESNNKVNLRSYHGTYLCAYPDGSKVNLQTRKGGSTEWVIIAHQNGLKGFSLQSCHDTYLTAKPNAKGGATLCLTADLGSYSVWYIEDGAEGSTVSNINAKVAGKFNTLGQNLFGGFK